MVTRWDGAFPQYGSATSPGRPPSSGRGRAARRGRGRCRPTGGSGIPAVVGQRPGGGRAVLQLARPDDRGPGRAMSPAPGGDPAPPPAEAPATGERVGRRGARRGCAMTHRRTAAVVPAGAGWPCRRWPPGSAWRSRSPRGDSGSWPSRPPACSGGGSAGSGRGPGCGPAGWPVSAATCPGSCGVRSFTLAGAVVLIAVEALFVALACLAVPAGPVVARALAFPAAMTLAEAARQTWPFGGLPIGGVFLGQADGPLLGVARLGGPLVLTAAVYLGGVGLGALCTAAVRTLRDRRRAGAFARADLRFGASFSPATAPVTPGLRGHGRGSRQDRSGRRRRARRPLRARGGRQPRARRRPVGRHGDRGRRAGRGCPGLHKSQVDPAGVLAAQSPPPTCSRRADHGGAPRLVLWPEDVVSLDVPLTAPPRRRSWRTWPAPRIDPRGRGDRDDLVDRVPQRGGGLRAGRLHRRPLREGPPGPLRRVRPLAELLRPPGQPVLGAARRRARHRVRAAHDSCRAPRDDDLLRGLLRGPGPGLGAGRRPAADRPDQHLVVRDRPGAHPGDRGRRGPGRAAGAGPAPGCAHRLLRMDHQPGDRAPGRCSAPARSSRPSSTGGPG